MKRAYSYLRFSSTEQAKGDSVRRQLKLRDAYLARHLELTLDNSLKADHGKSAFHGRHLREGAALSMFLEQIKAGKVPSGSVLILESLDRLSRQKPLDGASLVNQILSAGISIVTLQPEREYTAESAGDTFLALEIVLTLCRAHEESSMKSHRAKEAWDGRRAEANTRKLTGKAPFWLKLSADRLKWEVLPDMVRLVETIFQLCIDGYGLDSITEELYRRGIKPPHVRRNSLNWNRPRIGKLLRNRNVLGEFQPCEMVDGKPTPVGKVIPDYFPRVISDETFYRAQAALTSRKIHRGRKGEQVANLFSGLMVSVQDGSKYHLTNKARKKDQPNWNRTIIQTAKAQRGEEDADRATFPYAHIENAILDRLYEIKAHELTGETKVNAEDEVSVLDGKVKALRRDCEMLQKDMDENGVEPHLMQLLRSKSKELAEVEKALKEAESKASSNPADNLDDLHSLVELLRKAKDQDKLHLRTKAKALIANLVERITISVQARTRKDRYATVRIDYQEGGVTGFIVNSKGEVEIEMSLPQESKV